MEEEKGIFSKISSRASFFAGIGTAAFLFFSIGFFILLSIVLGGSVDKELSEEKNSEQVAGQKQDTGLQDGAEYGSVSVSQIDNSDWVKGNENADIALVVYSDIECPYCQDFYNTANQLLKEYPQNLKLVHRHLPLESLHSNSPKDAEAAECVGEIGGEGKFWEYLDLLYSTDLTEVSQLYDLASSIGVNSESFDSCLSSEKYAGKVADQLNDGAQAAEAASYLDSDTTNDGRWGTPFSVLLVDGETFPIPGAYPFDYLKSVIDSILEEK